MSRSITRRAFTTGVAALGMSGVAISSVAASGNTYAPYFRHYRRTKRGKTEVGLYVRVVNKSDFTLSVPVTLQLATDQAMKNVIWQSTGVASQSGSHIVREHTVLTTQTVPVGTPLYAGVLFGDTPALARVRRIRKQEYQAGGG